MIDREIVKEFLEDAVQEYEVPGDISMDDLVDVFREYLEIDVYDWLKDNFKCFFNYGNPDWDWIREQI